MKDFFTFRSRVVFIFVFIIGLGILARLFSVQILKGESFTDEAMRQHQNSIEKEYDRGEIFFKRKDGELFSAASLKRTYQVILNTNKLKSAEDAYQKISSLTPLDQELFFKCANKKNDPHEVVAKKINKSEADKIKELKIEGVSVSPEAWRYYPGDNLASQVLGYVGFKEDEMSGLYGVEKYYDNILTRSGSNSNYLNSFVEIFSDIKKVISKNYEKEGNIVLTIEPVVQSYFEKELNKTKEKFQAERIGGIIVEPKTGKILAMTGKPDFDPNNYSKTENISSFTNASVQNIYELGSIMKALTMASALDQGAVTPETTYVDKGFVIIDDEKIENFDKKARGKVNMQEVLNQSLNTGSVFVMQSLGKEKFKEYMLNFGFGEKTGIDLPGEVRGMTDIFKGNKDIDYASASFGQAIAVTPIQMVSALSSLANGGILMRPYVVEKIKSSSGLEKEIMPEEKRQVLKKETAEEITRMLVNVFDKSILGGSAKMEHYSLAVKTGTAQQASSGGYSETKHLHTFFGYGPAFDARFLILLFLENPVGARYAVETLSSPFINTSKFLFNYYEIPPDR